MLLPCRHIFTVRDHLNISRFEKDVCAKRWFLDVYVQSCGLTQNNECAGEELVQVNSRKDERILSAHQKFRKAAAIASTLADLASDCATPRFKERLNVLESILQSWRDNVEVTVTSCAPCTSNGVDTQSECLLDQVSQAAGGEGTQDSAELSDHSKQNCASGDLTQRRGAAEDYVTQGHSTQILDTLTKIKVPVTKKSCGRPKGQMVTVIGLPRKRKRTSTERPYAELTMKEKKLKLLTWLTGTQKAAEAMKGKLLDEDTVEQRPECVHGGIRDDNIDINLVRRFFTDDAWQAVQMVIGMKRQESWKCNECETHLDDHDSVMCDWCLTWNHLPCVGLRKQPKTKLWKCRVCSGLACTW
ncbi:unnamed protein product [Ixodes hexagonus]